MLDPVRRLLDAPPDLPVAAGLDAVLAALRARGTAVVQAPPGSGKTTLVPPAVADLVGSDRVVVTQPRRVAARAAARRLAGLLGEDVGESVGYAVRGDRRSGPDTRIEFVTSGVLLRRIQRDPELPGVAAVVLDEVHERAVEADLALALLLDVRAALREDLLLVAMSATVEARRTAALLAVASGPPAPVVNVPGTLHPVAVRWAPPPAGALAVDDRGVTPRFLDHVAAVTVQALTETGDVLVFLPGVREVDGVARRIAAGADVDVVPLHGRLPSREQDRALRPAGDRRRRVVVATAVAESSLTVPGVRVVVDAGLSREPRTDHRRGLAGLVTRSASRAAADQRAGRAGREGPGVVHRCWGEAEHAHRAAHPEPGITVADLTATALELAVWGTPTGEGLALLDRPPGPALAAARAVLADLGAVDAAGGVTARGRALADLPIDPRLARALLDGAGLVGRSRAAEVVALLSEEVRAPGGDLVAALRALRRGEGREAGAWRRSADRLRRGLPSGTDGGPPDDGPPRDGLTDDLAVGAVVALAHPDRVARRRGDGSAYLMVGGTGADLGRDAAALAGSEWIAIADVDRRPGERDARVRSAAPLDEELARVAAAARLGEDGVVAWEGGRVAARRVRRLGAVVLTSTSWPDPPAEAVAGAVREGLARNGLGALPWGEAARGLRARLALLRRELGDPWPDVSDAALAAGLDAWLGPEVARVRPGRGLGRVDLVGALRRLLPWPEAGRLDELAPERLVVPSGRSVAVDYAASEVGGDQPVLSLKLQEAFGWADTPRVADGRVPVLLHLLSPAGRPLAVTADLASFWSGPYAGVRAEMRGRYPRHPWPEDPWTAPATRRTNTRR